MSSTPFSNLLKQSQRRRNHNHSLPGTLQNAAHVEPTDRAIKYEMLGLRDVVKLTLSVDDDQLRAFLEQLSWDNPQLSSEESAMLNQLLITYNLFSAHLSFDKKNKNFQVLSTPRHETLASIQSLPTATIQKLRCLWKIFFSKNTVKFRLNFLPRTFIRTALAKQKIGIFSQTEMKQAA